MPVPWSAGALRAEGQHIVAGLGSGWHLARQELENWKVLLLLLGTSLQVLEAPELGAVRVAAGHGLPRPRVAYDPTLGMESQSPGLLGLPGYRHAVGP
jgi:hypothetical protein